MSRNRFQLIGQMLHFADNSMQPESDWTFKVKKLLKRLNQNFWDNYNTPQDICIDESSVPFRGRWVGRQYMPNKTNAYGLKLFKLSCEHGYTLKVALYTGKGERKHSTIGVVLKLMKDYLGKGHVLCTDNLYTTIKTAATLLNHRTHLIGMLNKMFYYEKVFVGN